MVRRGKVKKNFPIFAFSSRFFLFFPIFPEFFPIFPDFFMIFPDFWQFCRCQGWHSAPLATQLATPLIRVKSLFKPIVSFGGKKEKKKKKATGCCTFPKHFLEIPISEGNLQLSENSLSRKGNFVCGR